MSTYFNVMSLKKSLGIFFVSLALLFLNHLEAMAGPASNEIFIARQPDGSPLCIRLWGDEFFHYTTSEDGILIMENRDNGFYYYACQDENGVLAPSKVRATDIEHRNDASKEYLRTLDNASMIASIKKLQNECRHAELPCVKRGPGLFADATFPTVGKQKAIIILVEYQDVRFRINDPYDYFHRLLNQPGFSDFGATGSARDYFLASSEGAFDIDFDVYGPVVLPKNQAYYGSNGLTGKDGVNASMMVVDACNILDKDVDFSQYDRNNDGVIDNVFLFYAGTGEDSGGGSDAVWPHSADAPRGYAYDGKNLQSYGCTSEWVPRPTGSRPDGIGAFCHEFGHVLGLPDLYKTAASSPEPFTPGSWCLMDRGAHNNERRTPPTLDLFSRYALGWWTPQIIDSPKTCVLNPLNTSGEGYLIPTGDKDDFYLIENRQRTGWDTYVPGHGLLIWHIDYDAEVWARFAVNNDASHQHVDIIEADGILTEDTRSSDCFPGTAGVTALTSELYPALPAENTITDITENPDGTISFKFRGGSALPESVSTLDPADITPRSFIAKWNSSPTASDYRMRVYSLNTDGSEDVVPGFADRLTGTVTELEVSGLQPETQYFYTVKVVEGATESLASTARTVTTLPLTYDYIIPVANDATDISDEGFLASWLPVDDADSYKLTVKQVVWENVNIFSEAFDDKIATWTTNSDKFYSNNSYIGLKSPSLKLSGGGYVCTPLLPRGSARSFSFWHRAISAENALIHVEAYTHGCWYPLCEIIPVSAKGGLTSTIYDFPEDCDAVRISVTDNTGSASVFTDDFAAVTSTDISYIPVPEYSDIDVGDALSYQVKGLRPDSHYIFTVKALKGSDESMDSKAIHLYTKQSNALYQIESDDSPAVFKLYRRTAIVHSPTIAEIYVYDINGRIIRWLQTDSEGYATFSLPTHGIYIIKIGQEIFKAVVR